VDPATQEVYATWTLFGTGEDIMVSAAKGGAASAAAGALNFSRPQCLSCAGPSLLRDVITDSGGTGSFIAVGTDGTAYVTWIAGSAILLSTSVDQGAHWTPALDVIDIAPGGGGAPYRTPTMPQIAVDRSNALGIVYLTWQGAGAGSDVFVAKSVRGLLWGNPLKVNDDAGNAGQYFPSVCVSPVNGDVYVAWIDSRNDPAHVDYDLYGAVSHDGATTFGPNVRLSTQSSNPYLSYHQEGYTFIGDYDGSACAKDGTAYSTWPDTRNGRADLFVAHWD
jgi:hypothetical protein